MSDGTTLDAWLRFFAIVVTQFVVGFGIWATLKGRLSETAKKVDHVGEIAQEAADLSAPTANGYAGRSLSALARIEGAVTELSRPGGRVDRIQGELHEVRGLVTRHIEGHAAETMRRERKDDR